MAAPREETLFDKLAAAGIPTKGLRPGENYATCPKCSHTRQKNPRAKCFSIRLDDAGGAVWHCSHCDWAGNVPGADRSAPRRDSRQREIKPAATPRKVAEGTPYEKMLEWFQNVRGIGRETVETLGIFLTRKKFPQDGKDADPRTAIVFPYTLRGKVVNHKYRAVNEKMFCQDGGAMRTLYNVDSLSDNDVGIFCEGEIDIAACYEAGFSNAVSIPDGSPSVFKEDLDPDDKRYQAIVNCADEISHIERWIIAVDNDEAGRAHARQIVLRLGESRCWKVTYPEGCKDMDDVLLRHGVEGVQQVIERAVRWPMPGLFEQFEPGQLAEFRRKPASKLYVTGMPIIDRLVKFRLGQLFVFTGTPGSGKSEFVDFITAQFALRYGWRTVFFSPEHTHEEQAGKLIEKYIGRPFFSWSPNVWAMTDEEVESGQRWVNRHFSWIVPNKDPTKRTIDNILKLAYAAILRDRPQVIVLDPFNRIYMEGGDSETRQIGHMLQKVTSFAQEHNVLIIMVAHPAKMQPTTTKSDGERYRPMPGPYDIAGSAHWYAMADGILTVHRPNPKDCDVRLVLWKIKRKDQGTSDSVDLYWDRVSGRYVQKAEIEASERQQQAQQHELGME